MGFFFFTSTLSSETKASVKKGNKEGGLFTVDRQIFYPAVSARKSTKNQLISRVTLTSGCSSGTRPIHDRELITESQRSWLLGSSKCRCILRCKDFCFGSSTWMGTSSFNWTPGNSTKTHTANLINKKKIIITETR